jgi:hypothetical protein
MHMMCPHDPCVKKNVSFSRRVKRIINSGGMQRRMHHAIHGNAATDTVTASCKHGLCSVTLEEELSDTLLDSATVLGSSALVTSLSFACMYQYAKGKDVSSVSNVHAHTAW